MHNERIEDLATAGGHTVEVRFDLTDQQLRAVAHAAEAINVERFRGRELTADDVLRMRELTAVSDAAVERAQDGYAGGTLVMSVARLGLTVDALTEWLRRRDELGFLRRQEGVDRPVVEGMLWDLADLHLRALQVAVGAQARAGTAT